MAGERERMPPSWHVRRRMSNQARINTTPEMRLRRALHGLGLRYRVGYPVPNMPRRSMDIAFTRIKVAVFVDGCFWHRCPLHYVPAKNNAQWWANKLEENVQRDRSTDRALREHGWDVLRFWEHEDMEASAQLVYERVAKSPP